jgi:hypothetical protein
MPVAAFCHQLFAFSFHPSAFRLHPSSFRLYPSTLLFYKSNPQYDKLKLLLFSGKSEIPVFLRAMDRPFQL